MIFVTAMWIIIVLAALVLIFAHEMRVEVVASANRAYTDQASSIEHGAEQYVLAAVDACGGDAITVMQTPCEQIQISAPADADGSFSGNGYFWIMQPYPDSDQTPNAQDYAAYGITDEASKLNLNVATSPALSLLPQMTQPIADSIVLWRGGASSATTGQGADSSYYQTGPRPYTAKAAKFESVDELYLIRDMTDSILYGSDLNHNGLLDQNELGGGGLTAQSYNGVNGTGRGIAPFLTVWSQEPNTDSTGKARINISMLTNTTQLRTALTKALPAARVAQIIQRAMAARTFKSIFDFAAKTGMKQAELELVADSLTTSTSKTSTGLININTASTQVLLCLPGLTSADASAIIAERATILANASGGAGTITTGSASNTNTDYTWIMNAITTPAKLANIGSLITGRSFFYSADIVAVSANGRSFKRARIVVDARSSPPVIIYRKDLTYLGWPLDPQILAQLKANQVLNPISGYGTGAANGIAQSP
ncbi:MAG TPA: hypothetical protein VFE47_28720 [Tepidisphaeraceae bacterium]|jgi:type II secretory pathway component PulK|nr:hypothetical protein [Tepidisphaeraceae bacterium]